MTTTSSLNEVLSTALFSLRTSRSRATKRPSSSSSPSSSSPPSTSSSSASSSSSSSSSSSHGRNGSSGSDLSEWSRREVRRLFREHDLGEYEPSLREAKVDGSRLLALHHAGTLFHTLAVTKLAHKKKLRDAILRRLTPPPPSPEKDEDPERTCLLNKTKTTKKKKGRKGEERVVARLPERCSRSGSAKKNEARRIKNECDARTSEDDESPSAVTQRSTQQPHVPPVLGLGEQVSSPGRLSSRHMGTSLSSSVRTVRAASSTTIAGYAVNVPELGDAISSTTRSQSFSPPSSSPRSRAPRPLLCTTLAYSMMFGYVAVKLAYGDDISVVKLQRHGSSCSDSDDSDSMGKELTSRTKEGRSTPKRLKTPGKGLLYRSELRQCIRKLYGKDLLVFYVDRDDDRVSIESDASLNYAFRDWCNTVRNAKQAAPRSWRLLLKDPPSQNDVESSDEDNSVAECASPSSSSSNISRTATPSPRYDTRDSSGSPSDIRDLSHSPPASPRSP